MLIYPVKKQKYIDEVVGFWYIFGTYPDNSVDIHSSNISDTIISKVPKEEAMEIVKLQNDFISKLYTKLGC